MKKLSSLLRKPQVEQKFELVNNGSFIHKAFDAYFYNAPRDANNNKLYVPVVLPNKDIFVWYLMGYHTARESISEMIASQEPDEENMKAKLQLANPRGFNMFTIDSTRFNNILPNDRKEDSLTDEELDKFYEDLNNEAPSESSHKENSSEVIESIDYGFFSVECPSCHVPYKFQTQVELPDADFNCQCCGRLLIHYTGFRDSLFTYDTGFQNV